MWLGEFLVALVFWALAVSVVVFAVLVATTVVWEVRDHLRRRRRGGLIGG